MKIVIMEPLGISDDALKALTMLLRADGQEIVDYQDRAETDEALLTRVADADVIILADQPLRENVLSRCEHLKMIDVAFTGVDHIDVDYVKARGITICNAAGYSTNAVAELAIGLTVDVLRGIADCNTTIREGSAQFRVGTELFGKTFAIIGTGTIGMRVAEIAHAFGCRLIAYSRTAREEAKALGIEYLPLDEVMRQADIVSLHVPMTTKTRGMIGEREIGLMKDSAVLINTSRGPIVDTTALADALNNGRIAGAGIDVFDTEPPLPPDHPLLTAKNCVLTPHIAFATKEALYRRAAIVFENLRCWLEGKAQNVVS